MDDNEYLEMDENYWLEADLGEVDGGCDRTVEDDDSLSVMSCPPIPGLGYTDVYVSYSRQTFYALQDGKLIEIPRSEWMTTEQYRDWLNG